MSVFIQIGDAPLDQRQAESRGYSVKQLEMSTAGARPGDEAIFLSTPHDNLPARLVNVLSKLPGSPATFADYTLMWDQSNEANTANNQFNHGIAMYADAVKRLARYRLAAGQAEQTEQQPTGDYDDAGNAVNEAVLLARAIDPLPAEVEQTTFDELTGEQTGTTMVPNPAIVKDDAERAEAQAVIDSLPQSIADYYSATMVSE